MKDRLKVAGILLLSITLMVLGFAFSSWTQTSRTGRVSEGTAAQRPASANAGDMWMATDTGALSVYIGGAWQTFLRLDSAQSPQNKTLTAAGSGNVVDLLDNQAPTATLTGDGTDKTIFTYTIPANTVAAGKGVRICSWALHVSGTASVTFSTWVGGVNTHGWADAIGGITTNGVCAEIMNSPGVQNSQRSLIESYVNGTTLFPGGVAATSTVDFANAVIVKFTFKVAATDTVAGTRWTVQLIR